MTCITILPPTEDGSSFWINCWIVQSFFLFFVLKVPQAIRECHSAGVKVVMVTGNMMPYLISLPLFPSSAYSNMKCEAVCVLLSIASFSFKIEWNARVTPWISPYSTYASVCVCFMLSLVFPLAWWLHYIILCSHTMLVCPTKLILLAISMCSCIMCVQATTP